MTRWWSANARATRGMSLDGCIMADDQGRRAEVVDPPWWRVDRWWVWLTKTDGVVEFVYMRGWEPFCYRAKSRTRPMPPPGVYNTEVAGTKRKVVGRPVSNSRPRPS